MSYTNRQIIMIGGKEWCPGRLEATYELILKKIGSFWRNTDQGRHIPDERNIGKRVGIMRYRVGLMD